MSDSASLKEALPVMIGTAGHVDHGKTSLVRRLTGFDTDRLPEERARGLSIDFDVAPFRLISGGMAGIIDVPGHEDFVRNMVAGASSIDVLMLIVAADDAVMPQTVEHLRIARLMGISSVMVVVTKIDLVDSELLSLVLEDIQDFLIKSGFPTAAIYPVSNETGQGIEEVRRAASEMASSVELYTDNRAFRMFVRSSFSMKGHGTIVTGVPCSGSRKAGETLELLPSGERFTLRSVQTYREQVEGALPHRSSALNIREASVEVFSRGMTLSQPDIFRASKSFYVYFENLDELPLKHRGEYRFHVGTASLVCRAKTPSREPFPGASSGFLHLVLKEPCLACAGDRFVLRSLSPASTIGGGVILGANPGRVRKKDQESIRTRLLDAHRAVLVGEFLLAECYSNGSPVIRAEDISPFSQQSLEEGKLTLANLIDRGLLVDLGGGASLVTSRKPELLNLVTKLLARYHSQNRLAQGMRPEYLCDLLKLPSEAASGLLGELCKESEICSRHGMLALESFQPEINEREFQLMENLLRAVLEAQEKGVARGNVKSELNLSEKELKRVIKLLVDDKKVVLLGNILIDAKLIGEYRSAFVAVFKQKGEVSLADFRVATGLSRNLSVPVLEYFDIEGTSKRVGNGRVVIRKDLL